MDTSALAQLTNSVADVWAMLVTVARGQPVGTAIVLILLADGAFTLAGYLVDRLEGVEPEPSRGRLNRPSLSSRMPPAPTVHGPARAP